jgi:tRNA (guanine37-N1)-methyltransferase
MRIDIITVLPKLLLGPFDHSIIQRAREKGLVEIHLHDLRDFSTDKHRRVDDYAFGGDPGMVLSVEPIHRAIEYLKKERDYQEIIYTSPDGEKFSQKMANRFAMMDHILILCGHYKGVDQRVRDHLVTRGSPSGTM